MLSQSENSLDLTIFSTVICLSYIHLNSTCLTFDLIRLMIDEVLQLDLINLTDLFLVACGQSPKKS